MAIEAQDTEFRHPDTAACLRGLTDEEAAKHSPIVREQDGVAWQYWREGDRVCCREAASGGTAAMEAEFGRSLPRLRRGGGVPDLDMIETSLRGRTITGASGWSGTANRCTSTDDSAPPEHAPKPRKTEADARMSTSVAEPASFPLKNALRKPPGNPTVLGKRHLFYQTRLSVDRPYLLSFTT